MQVQRNVKVLQNNDKFTAYVATTVMNKTKSNEMLWEQKIKYHMFYVPCIILQYVYKPTRCTKFL
jgi:hypothetical protein